LDSGGTNNGTLFGNTQFGDGLVGQSFVFDGNGDAVRVGTPPALQLQSFTIEGWIRRFSEISSSLVAPDAEFLCWGQGGYGFGMWETGDLFLTHVGVSSVSVAGIRVTDTVWHHIAVTKSGTQVTFYVDGVANPITTYNAVFTFNSELTLGARADDLNTLRL
jgi:hypothetical protein